MEINKKEQVLKQYVDQYQPTIISTLEALKKNKIELRIPHAQFLFSIIEYYGLLFNVADGHYNKRDSKNFINIIQSQYFPKVDRCKGSFLWFIRCGLMHQIFAKGSGLGNSKENVLFYKDKSTGDNPTLNLDYLHKVTISAIDNFISDLDTNTAYIENLHEILIIKHYGFNDHKELEDEILKSFDGNSNKIFEDCA
jgi:hypothetical protein